MTFAEFIVIPLLIILMNFTAGYILLKLYELIRKSLW